MSKAIIADTACHIDVTLGKMSQSAKSEFLAYHLNTDVDLVVVYGDCATSIDAARATNGTMAHVEAGLRCGDMRMAEERYRKEIDHLADILYAPSLDAAQNLSDEGISEAQLVGNVMADSFYFAAVTGLRQDFGLVTMHRPENVDDASFMDRFLAALANVDCRFMFPKHPRVHLRWVPQNVEVIDPLPYRAMLVALCSCQFVITDSGGVQEEATLAHTPCLTMRPSTERPITITEGTNELSTPELLSKQIALIKSGNWKHGTVPALWDGRASERIACHLRSVLS